MHQQNRTKPYFWAFLLITLITSCQKESPEIEKSFINTIEVTNIILEETKKTLEVGTKHPLKATIIPATATKKEIQWSSSNPTILQVNPQGEIEALRPGQAIITARSHNGKTGQCEVTVTDKNNTSKYDWIKLKTQITYNSDGTEYSRMEYTYDEKGRQIDFKYYSNTILSSQNTNYLYTGKECTFESESYSNGIKTDVKRYKRVFLDDLYIKYTSNIAYNPDGTEYSRMEYTYDEKGREIDFKYYSNTILLSQSTNYQYTGKECTFELGSYSNGIKTDVKRYKRVFLDNLYIKYTSNIAYNPDGTEYSRMEYTYDEKGREIDFKYYSNTILLSQNTNYRYTGKECIFELGSYSNGIKTDVKRYKRIYK